MIEEPKMGITYHYAWVLGLDWGIKNLHERSGVLIEDIHNWRKQFDNPYIYTVSKDYVRYQILPAAMEGHSVNLVKLDVWVQPDVKVQVWDGHFHCVRCGIMGSRNTLRSYQCQGSNEAAKKD